MSGEWKAPATCKRTLRPRRPSVTSSSASSRPETTVWRGVLKFAATTAPPDFSAASATASASAPIRATIPPGFSFDASFIRRSRSATSRAPSRSPRLPAAWAAAYSPSEWPATTSALIPASRKRYRRSTELAKTESWYGTASSPTQSSTASRTEPLISPPAVPWPGKTKARFISLPRNLDPVQVRSPGQTEPEAHGDDVPALLHLVVDVRVRERDASSRRIPEPVQVDDHAVLRHLHLLHGGAYYACICLVGDDVLDLVGREPVARDKLLNHIRQYPHGELEDFSAVLEELLVVARVSSAPERGSPAVG